MLFFFMFGFFLFLARSFDTIRFAEYFPPFGSLISFAHGIVFLLNSTVSQKRQNRVFSVFFIAYYAFFFKQQEPLSNVAMGLLTATSSELSHRV